ncbi:MAG TPA: NUDIX domain-containing protein [Gemmatimonadaceae bacterium]|nr:NUDIX domain-containing protein [Gemmatimonadaceae bacterium]
MTTGKKRPANDAAKLRSRSHKPRRETSAGGIVFRKESHSAEPLYLLIRDSYQNWGFPKGHLEEGEQPDAAALREVSEETGLAKLEIRANVETIDWHFRFRGRLIHKVCHFYLMEAADSATKPQRAEGITACKWARYDDAAKLISYENARAVLTRAHTLLAAKPGEREKE